MKVRVKTTAAVVALFAAVAGTASFAQTVTYTPGDLVIGFQATESGSTGDGQNFLLNIGAAVNYRDGNVTLGTASPIANIGDQLSAIYGAAWFGRSDMLWGAVGMRQDVAGIGAVTPIVNGDSRGVIYASKESTGIGESGGWAAFTRNQVASASKEVFSVLQATNPLSGGFANQSAVAGTDGLGAVVGAGLSNSWTNLVGVSGSSFRTFPTNIQGVVNFGDQELIYLDIFRVAPDGSVPSWVVTLALDNAGNVYAVPEPSTYAALIGAAGLALVIARRARRNKAVAA